jgi:uncharacterized repeat protein (TIGR01451 family)
MRNRRWWLGIGTVVTGMSLGVWSQLGWGQPGDLPGVRPPTMPPLAIKEPAPVPPELAPSTQLPPPPGAAPEVSLPPAPTLPPPELEVPLPPAAPMNNRDVGDPLPPLEPAQLSPAPVPIVTAPNTPIPTTPIPITPTPMMPVPIVTAPISPAQLAQPRLETVSTPSLVAAEAQAVKREPAVSIEWLGAATARLNQPMTCQILVRNTGSATVNNVVVRHRLNPGVTCRRTEPPAATEGDDLVWTVGTMAPGQQRRLELQVVCSQRGALHCQAPVTFAASAGQQVQVREPLLAIKMRAPEKANVGDNVNLLFAVANPGDGVTELIKVRALLPEGLESSRGRVVELDIGSLAPKESRTLQIACIARTSGNHKSTIMATADGNLSASDHAMTEVLEAKLDLVVQGPKLRYLDRHAVYQLRVTNPGTAPAQNLKLNKVVPAGFKFHGATAGGRWDESTKTVSWQLGDLPPGQSRDVSIELVAAAAGEHRLQAQVVSARGVKTEASAVTRIEGSSSLVIELVDVDDPVEVGGETSYEIRVTNAGTKMETNLQLSCTLPDQLEYRGAKTAAGIRHRVEGREVVFDPLPRLAPKADIIYRVTVRGTAAGDVRFRTRVRADGMPEAVLREESTRFYNDR